jgi:hypothetical protein
MTEITQTQEALEVTQKPEALIAYDKRKAEISALVEANPFIEITDWKTYEEAKKRRTALVKIRTGVEKDVKGFKAMFKQIVDRIADLGNDLIKISSDPEEKQQAEVKRYEAEQEAKREEERMANENRINAIKNTIEGWYQTIHKFILTCKSPADCVTAEFQINSQASQIRVEEYEEFIGEANMKISALRNEFSAKKTAIDENETLRIQNEKAEKDRVEAENKRIEEEAKRIEAEELNTLLGAQMDYVLEFGVRPPTSMSVELIRQAIEDGKVRKPKDIMESEINELAELQEIITPEEVKNEDMAIKPITTTLKLKDFTLEMEVSKEIIHKVEKVVVEPKITSTHEANNILADKYALKLRFNSILKQVSALDKVTLTNNGKILMDSFLEEQESIIARYTSMVDSL